jgi:hypothetical protein
MKPGRVLLLLALAVVGAALACRGRAEFPYEHRSAALACPENVKPESERTVRGPDAGTPPPADATWCSYDSDCTKGKNGRCNYHGHRISDCTYSECSTDADCKEGQLCNCEATGNQCVSANCRTDAECGGRGCSPSYGHSCNGERSLGGFYCHTAKDSCTDDGDCSGSTSHCVYQPEVARWTCVDAGHCVG